MGMLCDPATGEKIFTLAINYKAVISIVSIIVSRKKLLLWCWRALGHKNAMADPRLMTIDGYYTQLNTLSPEECG